MNIQTFINRWQASGAAERANYQLFLAELCDVIGVAHPQPASENPHENAYVFEKRVPSAHGTTTGPRTKCSPNSKRSSLWTVRQTAPPPLWKSSIGLNR